jgi:type I restriction enzyme S subunit
LEEAAQKLYKEWFVKLNFPGHENVKIVDGVPEGWKKLTIEELLSEHFNGGWGKETLTGNFKNSGFVIRGTDINDIEQGQFSDIPYRYHSDKDIKTKNIREGDIIFELSNGNINNIGRTLLVTNELLVTLEAPVICASFCKLFRPKNWNYSILLKREIEDMQISKRLLPYKKNGANGINNFAFNDFLNHKLLIPEANSKLYSYLEKYEKAKTQIQKKLFLLQTARDKLLPRLMNGDINV